jgi:hypothetical protein
VPDVVRLIATARQNYGGRWYSCGETFEATKADACDLIALRFAALAVEEPPKPDNTLHLPQGRRYRRRDMEPER